jgi:hypothetical protein
MNNFKTKKIDSQTIAIIDLWSYKIRVAICEYRKKDKEKQIKLLSFAEKRQSVWDINQNQINDLENVCENIKIAIEKAEKKANIKVNDFIINSTFSNSFLESSKINYKREKKSQIDINELKKILKEVEKKSILSHIKKIEKKYLYSKQDLNLILNNFSNITINKEKTSSLLGLNWEQISFFITNVFISKSSNETLKYISKFINKNLIEIIPEEFSLTKLWEKNKNIVILNMWNTSSYIIIKDEDSNIIWSIKLEVWIEKLIEQIKENTWLTRSEIIKKIDRDDFAKSEKKDFLEIYSFLIIQALKEILNNKICPNNFFIIGWWWNNSFLKNYFKKINFEKFWLKINGNIKYIIPDIKKIAKIENVEDILNKSNLNIISQIITYNFLLQKKENTIEKISKKIIEKLED